MVTLLGAHSILLPNLKAAAVAVSRRITERLAALPEKRRETLRAVLCMHTAPAAVCFKADIGTVRPWELVDQV